MQTTPLPKKVVHYSAIAYLIRVAQRAEYLEYADKRFNRVMLRAVGKGTKQPSCLEGSGA